MKYFKDIRRSDHYIREHANVPWSEVVHLILLTKNARKKGNTYVIKENGFYIVYSVNNNTVTVINAKRLQ